jgi:hypothetical protein
MERASTVSFWDDELAKYDTLTDSFKDRKALVGWLAVAIYRLSRGES